MNSIFWSVRGGRLALVLLLVPIGGGCTSAISTAYLRETLWDFAEHASETDPEPSAAADTAGTTDSSSTSTADEAVDEERRKAAIDEAVARVKRLGPLDDATRATLIETLQQTQQEDWPVVVEAFASTLEEISASDAAAEEVVDRAGVEVVPASHVAAKADLDAAAIDVQVAPVAEAPAKVEADGAGQASALPPVVPPVLVPQAETESAPAVATPAEPPPVALSLGNACFASRVQGWGVVDRFTESRFQPGQEVIVYFELDNLTAGESPAGHTTCIDAKFTLYSSDDRIAHEWSFEPLAETCRAQRRDYFARYVITLPASLPAGPARIEVAVVDTLAGTTARATLPLEVDPKAAP